MASSGVRTRVPLPRRSRTATSPTDLRPAAGHYLLAGVEAVLSQFGDGAPPAGRLADELRGALARTAACGDTCRVRLAADSVREAANLLRDGVIDQAELVLIRVRNELTSRPHR